MTSLLAKTLFLAQAAAPAASAPAAGASADAAQQGAPSAWVQPAMMILFAAGFYFLLIRPQQKKAKETARKQSELKTGDKVATSAGIIGKVVTLDDSSVTLEVSSGVRIPFQRTHITEFLVEETAKA